MGVERLTMEYLKTYLCLLGILILGLSFATVLGTILSLLAFKIGPVGVVLFMLISIPAIVTYLTVRDGRGVSKK
jgi:hypothetical protein